MSAATVRPPPAIQVFCDTLLVPAADIQQAIEAIDSGEAGDAAAQLSAIMETAPMLTAEGGAA